MDPELKARLDDIRTRIDEIEPQAAKALIDDGTLLIDVREPFEYEAGHIAGSLNIPMAALAAAADPASPDRDERLAPDQPVVLHCGVGARSLVAADALKDMGFTDVRSMRGGIGAWYEEGLPVES